MTTDTNLGAAPQQPNRNDPLSALSIRLLVAAGHVTQEKADEAFTMACRLMEDEARRLDVTLPWVSASPNAVPAGHLPMPTNAHDAECMAKLGMAYLKQHAPERLVQAGQAAAPADGEDLYLVHAGGDGYQAKIVPASQLDDAYLLAQWGTLADIDPEQRRDALEHFHDDDEWTHEEDSGRGARVKFSLALEDGWVEVVRLPRLPAAAPAGQAAAPRCDRDEHTDYGDGWEAGAEQGVESFVRYIKGHEAIYNKAADEMHARFKAWRVAQEKQAAPAWAGDPSTQDYVSTQQAAPAASLAGQRAAAAERTLQRLGYTYHGGEFWKPPLGPVPARFAAAPAGQAAAPGFHLESRPCPECGATMLYDEGEPWDGPTWGCIGCGHSENVASQQAPAAEAAKEKP